MMIQCESCIHKTVCRNTRIVEQITRTIDTAIDHIEVTTEDKVCGVKDIPWIDLNNTAIECTNYRPSTAYRNAIQMTKTYKDAVSHML